MTRTTGAGVSFVLTLAAACGGRVSTDESGVDGASARGGAGTGAQASVSGGGDRTAGGDSADAGGGTAAGGGGTRGPGGSGGGEEVPSGQVEVFSWFAGGGERSGLEALFAVFSERYPEVEIVFSEQVSASDARIQLQDRLIAGNPPDVSQELAGLALKNLASTGVVKSIDDFGIQWRHFPSDVVAEVSHEGAGYGVPLDVARINSVYYSTAILGQDFVPPTTIEDLHAVLAEIRREHPDVAPLAFGNAYLWTMNLLVWEMLMPAVAGADFYLEFWRGQAEFPSPSMDPDRLRAVLTEALSLYCGVGNVDATRLTLLDGAPCDGYFNADMDTLDWVDALRMVENGTAAMAPMGSWASATFVADGLVPVEDFGVFGFPGEPSFVWAANAFVPLAAAANPDNAQRFLETVGSREGQLAFSRAKGSIPARTDLSAADGLDELSLGMMADFFTDHRLPSRSILGVEPAMADLPYQLNDSLLAHDMNGVYEYIVDHYTEVAAIYQ